MSIASSLLVSERPLRGLERVQVGVAGHHDVEAIIVVLDGSVAEDRLRASASMLARRYAALRTTVPGRATGTLQVHASPLSDPPVERVEGPWERVVEGVLAEPLGAIPWGVRVVADGDHDVVILAVHHALVDGRSLGCMVCDLLAGVVAAPNVVGVVGPSPAALERLRPPRLLALSGFLLRRGWVRRLRAVQADNPFHAPSLSAGRPIPTCFTSRMFPLEGIERLRQAARPHGATVGGALVVAAADATGSLLFARGVWDGAGWLPSIDADVDLRPKESTEPIVGMWSGGAFGLGPARIGTPRWIRATRASRDLRRQVQLGVPLMTHVVADGVSDPASWLTRHGVHLDAHGGVGSVARVSDIGPWDRATAFGALRLRAVFSAASAVRTGPALIVWLCTVDRRGCLSAIANGAAVGPDELDVWLHAVERVLAEMASVPERP